MKTNKNVGLVIPIPEGFGLPFYYLSLFNIGVFYLADLEVAQP